MQDISEECKPQENIESAMKVEDNESCGGWIVLNSITVKVKSDRQWWTQWEYLKPKEIEIWNQYMQQKNKHRSNKGKTKRNKNLGFRIGKSREKWNENIFTNLAM
jgi:hypothetical protein